MQLWASGCKSQLSLVRLGLALVMVVFTVGRWIGVWDEPDSHVLPSMRNPRLSLCFDWAELLPGRRLAPFLACCCSNMSRFGSTKLRLSLTDLWEVLVLSESVGNHEQTVKRQFSSQINELNGISFSHTVAQDHTFTHSFFLFCFSGQILMRWRQKLWRSRQN